MRMFLLIENYMSKLTENYINQFAIKHNIFLSGGELRFTYNYIKENWRTVLKNPDSLDIEVHSNKFSPSNFKKIKYLINEYHKKYGSYL